MELEDDDEEEEDDFILAEDEEEEDEDEDEEHVELLLLLFFLRSHSRAIVTPVKTLGFESLLGKMVTAQVGFTRLL